MSPEARREIGIQHERLKPSGELIKTRVLTFFDGADMSLTDGTPQEVGPITVSIKHRTNTVLGKRSEQITTYLATSNETVLARHTETNSLGGEVISNKYQLYGNVNGQNASLSLTEAPNHEPTIEAQAYSTSWIAIPLKEVKRDHKKELEYAFRMKIPF